jgi:hypothetical protein
VFLNCSRLLYCWSSDIEVTEENLLKARITVLLLYSRQQCFWLSCCFHLQGRNQVLLECWYLPIYTMSCPRILQSWCSLLWGPQILHTHKKSMFVHCLILLLGYYIEFGQLIYRLHHAWATFPSLGAKLSFCLRVKGRPKLLNKIN